MHSLFIISAEVKDWFNARAQELGNNGIAVASLALSASGNEPGTHGWCGVALIAEKEAQVKALIDANPGLGVDWTRYDLGTDPGWPDQRAAQLGLQRIKNTLTPGA
jgi:hypothetical protein